MIYHTHSPSAALDLAAFLEVLGREEKEKGNPEVDGAGEEENGLVVGAVEAGLLDGESADAAKLKGGLAVAVLVLNELAGAVDEETVLNEAPKLKGGLDEAAAVLVLLKGLADAVDEESVLKEAPKLKGGLDVVLVLLKGFLAENVLKDGRLDKAKLGVD